MHWLCTVRLASGDSVQVSTERLEIIQNARGPVVVAVTKNKHDNATTTIASGKEKGLPYFEVVKRLSKQVQRLEKRGQSYETRLEQHRTARFNLRQQVDAAERLLTVSNEKITKEQTTKKEIYMLSEKRRLACVKLRNQGECTMTYTPTMYILENILAEYFS